MFCLWILKISTSPWRWVVGAKDAAQLWAALHRSVPTKTLTHDALYTQSCPDSCPNVGRHLVELCSRTKLGLPLVCSWRMALQLLTQYLGFSPGQGICLKCSSYVLKDMYGSTKQQIGGEIWKKHIFVSLMALLLPPSILLPQSLFKLWGSGLFGCTDVLPWAPQTHDSGFWFSASCKAFPQGCSESNPNSFGQSPRESP